MSKPRPEQPEPPIGLELRLPYEYQPPAIVTGVVGDADRLPVLRKGAQLANAECGVEDRYVLELLPPQDNDDPKIIRYRMAGSWLTNAFLDVSAFWKQVRQLEAAEQPSPKTDT